MVPSHLAEEGRKLSTLSRFEEWKGKPAIVVRRYEEAWRAVVKAWPGVPVFGARRVVERLVRLRVQPGRGAVEQAVARYALRCWSVYKVKLEARGVMMMGDGDEGGGGGGGGSLAFRRVDDEVKRDVEGRVMGVLRGWMGEGVGTREAEEVFVRLGLMRVGEEEEERERGRGVCFS